MGIFDENYSDVFSQGPARSAQRVCLNLGCGDDYRQSSELERWVNADISEKVKTDFCFDIEWAQWPFADNLFDQVDAIQVLEHIRKEKFFDVISEIYRICKNGAVLNIQVPHGFSDNFITDPTHKMPFSTRTFDYFIEGTDLRKNGIIYGWEAVRLRHVHPPGVDGNHSIIFSLEVCK